MAVSALLPRALSKTSLIRGCLRRCADGQRLRAEERRAGQRGPERDPRGRGSLTRPLCPSVRVVCRGNGSLRFVANHATRSRTLWCTDDPGAHGGSDWQHVRPHSSSSRPVGSSVEDLGDLRPLPGGAGAGGLAWLPGVPTGRGGGVGRRRSVGDAGAGIASAATPWMPSIWSMRSSSAAWRLFACSSCGPMLAVSTCAPAVSSVTATFRTQSWIDSYRQWRRQHPCRALGQLAGPHGALDTPCTIRSRKKRHAVKCVYVPIRGRGAHLRCPASRGQRAGWCTRVSPRRQRTVEIHPR